MPRGYPEKTLEASTRLDRLEAKLLPGKRDLLLLALKGRLAPATLRGPSKLSYNALVSDLLIAEEDGYGAITLLGRRLAARVQTKAELDELVEAEAARFLVPTGAKVRAR